jgi:translation initiation factor 2 alpha subunit (eIF-2alpha)
MVYLFNNKKPKFDDIVLVKITDINNLNIIGELIDYNNMTAYISYSELCKKKRYNLHKIVNIGKEVIAQVLSIDKNYVELSIKRLVKTDIETFNNYRKSYYNLYSLWRYIYMKLNPELNMDINNIDSENINNFMQQTLWTIQNNYELNNDDEIFNPLEFYNNLINKDKNQNILDYINEFDIQKIKNILDDYSIIKNVPIKQIKNIEFYAFSFDMNGLANIKNAMNYKIFENYEEISKNNDVSLLYQGKNKYLLNIKQKNASSEDINIVSSYLINQIKKNCEENNINFNI